MIRFSARLAAGRFAVGAPRVIEVAEAHDPVRLSFIRAVLAEAGVEHAVFDTAAQALWPGAFRARVMTAPRDAWLARKALEAADAEREVDAP